MLFVLDEFDPNNLLRPYELLVVDIWDRFPLHHMSNKLEHVALAYRRIVPALSDSLYWLVVEQPNLFAIYIL